MEAHEYYLKLSEEVKTILDKLKLSRDSQGVNIGYFSVTDRKTLTISGTPEELKIKLSEIIYTYYTKPRAIDQIVDENYLQDLKNAYRSDENTSKFREGWILEENQFDIQGSILVNKDNYFRKQVLAGAYLSDDYPLKIGMPVKARWHLTSNNNIFERGEVSSFYEVSGTHLPNDYVMSDIFVRFYFNLNPVAANFREQLVNLLKTVTSELNTRFVPFQFKLLYQKIKMNRADSAVLYIDKRYFFLVIQFIRSLARQFQDILLPETPMFTFAVTSGIGFAEQPPLEKTDKLHFKEIPSFGQHRSAILAYGIIEWFVKNNLDLKDPRVLLEFLSNKQTSAAPIFYMQPDKKEPDTNGEDFENNQMRSAFFLNKKSEDYPYVQSYFEVLPTPSNEVPLSPIQDEMLENIQLIGYKLCSEGIWDSYGRCSWVGLDDNLYRTIDNSVIDGLAGTIMFLHGLWEETKNPTFEMYLGGAAKCLTYKLLDKIIWAKKNGPGVANRRRLLHGYYKGDLMAIVTLKKLKLNFPFLPVPEPYEIVERLQNTDPEIYSLGIYDGLAGTLLSLLELNKLEASSGTYLKGSIEIAESIIDFMFNLDQSGYQLKTFDKPLQIGFHSGASGIAFSLLSLYHAIDETAEVQRKKIFDTSIALLEYENTLKFPFGWRFPDGSLISYKWSIGMNNMSLSRIALSKLIPVNQNIANDLNDIALFMKKRVIPGFGIYDLYFEEEGKFNFGTAAVRLELNKLKLLETDWKVYSEKIFAKISEDNLTFRNSSDVVGFNPGIQGGYSGLGYLFLQLFRPHHYPSILIP